MGEVTDNRLSLGDLVNFKRGYDLPHRDREDGEVPIISSSGRTGWHKHSMAKAPGVVTGRYGTLGEVFYVENDYWPLNTSLYVQDFKGNTPKFIYYYLKTVLNENFNSAGAVPGVNRNYLHKMKVPSVPVNQDKIAAILSAYDDLIENNKRRISLLEQMAEEIYLEWFVRFRFPGYQTAPFEKGIPKGWGIVQIKDIVDRSKFGKIYREKDLSDEGKVIVIDQSKADCLGFYDGEPEHRASTEQPMILFGDHSCKMLLILRDFSLAENVIPFKPKGDMPVHFLFHLIKNRAKTTEYKRHWTDLTTQNVLIPSIQSQTQFSEQVVGLYGQIESLKAVVVNLIKTRDMLLPRLISGKLSVEDLDLQFPPGMINETEAV